MPHLESRIQDWCEAIKARGGIDDSSIAELRDHIHCDIDVLRERGYTEDEAFSVAISNLGNADELASELRSTSIGSEELLMSSDITAGHVALFSRQLASMVSAGVPLVQSCEVVAKGTDNPNMKDLILEVRDALSAGNSLTGAVREHPDEFDNLFCFLIDRGEQSGHLDAVLERIGAYRGKIEDLRIEMRSCVSYCYLMAVVAIGTLTFLGLPSLGLALVAVGFGVFGLRFSLRSPIFRERWERRIVGSAAGR